MQGCTLSNHIILATGGEAFGVRKGYSEERVLDALGVPVQIENKGDKFLAFCKVETGNELAIYVWIKDGKAFDIKYYTYRVGKCREEIYPVDWYRTYMMMRIHLYRPTYNNKHVL